MGWIKLDRKILEHWIWKDKPYSKGQAWIDLLLLANHEDKAFISGTRKIEAKRGNIYKSVLFLANRWGWSRKKVMGLLMALQKDNMITQNSTTHGTTITIVNYEKYQNRGQRNGQQMDNRLAKKGQQSAHIQEYKKNTTYSKEEKKSGCAAKVPPPGGMTEAEWDTLKAKLRE